MRFRISGIGLASVVLLTAFQGMTWAAGSLVDAVRLGDRVAALKLIEQKADVNAPSEDGSTPLAWAVHHNDADLVDRLIKAGAKANAKNEFGATPMTEAANTGNAAIMKKLLDAGGDANTVQVDGQTLLMVLARGSHVDTARLLMERGANVNATEQQRKQTALMWAAAENQPGMVKELLAHGADPNLRAVVNNTATANYSTYGPLEWPANVSSEPRAAPRNPGGLTALLYATREGCSACVKALVAGKANLDMPDPEGVTPLIMAITNLHFDAAAELIKGGANPDRWDLWGRNPLYCAVDMNTLPHGGRYDRPSTDETTPLKVIEMLLDAGANPNLQLKLFPPYRSVGADRGVDGMLTIGTTPLLRAAKGLDAPAIALLVKHGANLVLSNNRGITPVLAAAGQGSTDADTRGYYTTDDTAQRSKDSLELLVKAGADVNSVDSAGQTPLHAAAFWGWNAAVQFLIDHGANVNAKNTRGLTPVDAAMGRNGGNSRQGARIDVHQDTADLLAKVGGVAGTGGGAAPPLRPAGGRGGQ